MTRFWITLEQAVDLVLFALEHMVGGEVFIPKIPSTKVTDLAAAIAPDAPTTSSGIRPGEKLHEVLLTSDEARHCVDAGEVYVVLPEHPWWTDDPRWVEGRPLDGDFAYASNTNDWWLDTDELRALLAMIPYGRQRIDADDIAAVVSVLKQRLADPGASRRGVRADSLGHRRPSRRRVLERHRRPARRRSRRRPRSWRPRGHLAALVRRQRRTAPRTSAPT